MPEKHDLLVKKRMHRKTDKALPITWMKKKQQKKRPQERTKPWSTKSNFQPKIPVSRVEEQNHFLRERL